MNDARDEAFSAVFVVRIVASGDVTDGTVT